MKIDDMIKALQQARKEFGNKRVFVSADPAGNAYGDMGKRLNIDILDDKILLYPERKFHADDLDKV